MKNNKGVTLIELVISLSILVIVVGPFLGVFLSSTKNSAFSMEVLDSSSLSQKVMEEIKSRPEFLKEEAILKEYEMIKPYKKYYDHGDYEVKYKIIKEEEEISSEIYEFYSLKEKEFDVEIYVDTVKVTIDGYSFQLSDDPIEFNIEISQLNGVFRYNFFDNNNTVNLSKIINQEILLRPLRIKIHYVDNYNDILVINANIDKTNEADEIHFYTIDDRNNICFIKNTGDKPFYKYSKLTTDYVEYTNYLYKISVIVEKDNMIIDRLVSYVKKNR
ncbi:UNVERIFIED_CONTAM: prepilin-type N-terminal cleavage/methylation domain-containing protein [Acetivibrio alkalicellulosi]